MRVNSYQVKLDALRRPVLVSDAEVFVSEGEWEFNSDGVVKVLDGLFGLSSAAEEYTCAVAFSGHGTILGAFEVYHGTNDQGFMVPREILKRMLLIGASSFAVAHNHPSGDVSPSSLDREACRMVAGAGEIIQLPCVDFLIIGSKRPGDASEVTYYSFAEHKEL